MDLRAKRTAELLEHTGWLRELARHLVTDPGTADDVVQATLVVALERPGWPRDGLRAWLGGVARNVARQLGRTEARRRHRQHATARPEETASTDEMVELVETQRTLSAAVLGLAEPYRTTVLMRYFEGRAPTEIAAQLEVPAATVRVRLKRALELLRQRLDREYGDDGRTWGVVLAALAVPKPSEAVAASTPPTLLGGLLVMNTSLKIGLAAAAVLSASALLATRLPDLGGVDVPTEAVPTVQAPTLPAGPAEPAVAALDDGTRSIPAISAPHDAAPPPDTDDCCIVGQVRDAAGRALAGASVEAVDGRPHAAHILTVLDRDEPLVTNTLADGSYRLRVADQRPFLLRFTHPDHSPATVRTAFAGERHDAVLHIGSTLTLTVLSGSDGRPLAGARVGARSIEGFGSPRAWSLSGQTDDEGRAVLDHVPSGALHASAAYEGFAAGLWRLTSDGTERLDHTFRLDPEVELLGVVLDGATDEPIPAADVQCDGLSARTNSNGRFRIGGLGASAVTTRALVAHAEGYAPQVVYQKLTDAGSSHEIALRLSPAARVTGRVVDPLGSPVADATVVFRGSFQTNPFTAERNEGRVLTDGHGRFELPGLHPESTYVTAAQAPGYAVTFVTIGPLGGAPVALGDLVLTRGEVLAGEVRRRVSNANGPDTVLASLVTDRTQDVTVGATYVDAQGTFRFDDLAPGTYALELLPWDDEAARPGDDALVRRTVSLGPGSAGRPVVLELGATIRGRVVGPDGKRARAVVSLHPAEGAPALDRTEVERDGSFEFPAGDRGPFFLLASDPTLLFDPAVQDRVLAGTHDVELRLRPRATGQRITGRILNEDGTPAADVYVHYTDTRTGVRLARVGIPDEQGWFETDNLDDTPYDLLIVDFDDRYEPASMEGVAPNGEPVELELVRRR